MFLRSFLDQKMFTSCDFVPGEPRRLPLITEYDVLSCNKDESRATGSLVGAESCSSSQRPSFTITKSEIVRPGGSVVFLTPPSALGLTSWSRKSAPIVNPVDNRPLCWNPAVGQVFLRLCEDTVQFDWSHVLINAGSTPLRRRNEIPTGGFSPPEWFEPPFFWFLVGKKTLAVTPFIVRVVISRMDVRMLCFSAWAVPHYDWMSVI